MRPLEETNVVRGSEQAGLKGGQIWEDGGRREGPAAVQSERTVHRRDAYEDHGLRKQGSLGHINGASRTSSEGRSLGGREY